ncbi:MAG: S16 family serine protease [Nanoarchaeota archaeon]
MNKAFVFICLLLLSFPLALAKEGKITLLTVSEGREIFGGTAELFLEITPGQGRIFIETVPLMKVDTQISIRFSQEFACSYLDIDCSRYDFYYRIKADSNLVGGPSAGVPITILTIALLGDYSLRNDTVSTGTINAGGVVGPVAGIMAKARAAEEAGFSRILVPPFNLPAPVETIDQDGQISEVIPENVSQVGINIPVNESDLSIDVVRVQDIEEALFYFTGMNFSKENGDIVIPGEYTRRMRHIAEELCNRSYSLNDSLAQAGVNASQWDVSQDKLQRGQLAYAEGNYYSAASYCFSANLLFRQFRLEGYSNEELFSLFEDLLKNMKDTEENMGNLKLTTLSDLETFMIVSERIKDAYDVLEGTIISNISGVKLAYAIERYNSAISWSRLFGMGGRGLELDDEYLKGACLKKITETEERYNFVNLYVDGLLGDIQKGLADAYADYAGGRYASCLFGASKAKAEANILLSGLTIPRDQLGSYVETKLVSARRVIYKESQKDIFPILGYSYYEYARTLQEDDPFSALTFSEYALEMSNLDMYFPRRGEKDETIILPSDFIWGLVIGFLLGVVAVFLFRKRRMSAGKRLVAGRVGMSVKKKGVTRTRRKARRAPTR